MDELTRSLGVPELLARVLIARGFSDPTHAARYLEPRLADMPDPFLLAGMESGAARLTQAIESRQSVALYGDYDVDGVTSTALLQEFLMVHGVRARSYIPHRLEEGYGLHHDAVGRLADDGIELLITLDCGITAVDEVAYANDRGMDVIVVDHHRCPVTLPAASATLNPHQPGCLYPDKVLAAVGVAFNLAAGVRKNLRARGYYQRTATPEPNLRRALDLVALGTIADMVPLVGVNRLFAWFGLQEMRQVRRPGMRALFEVSEVRPARLSSQDVSFKLAPRVNAAGRLDDASVGVQLLTSGSFDEARLLATRLDAANQERRLIQAEVFTEAVAQAEQQSDHPALVVHHECWHPGVVGIVASKLVETFGKTALVIGQDGRGSGRAHGGLHLFEALSSCSDLLLKFGGHRAAAGFRLKPKEIQDFAARFRAQVAQHRQLEGSGEPELHVDFQVRAEEISLELVNALSRLEPFGIGNPQPLCRMEALPVKRTTVVGGHHLKLRLGEGPRPVSAIAFRHAALEPDLAPGTCVELAGHLEVNDFAGFERVQFRVRDLKMPTKACG